MAVKMSGHRKVLRFSEEACQLELENGAFPTTLGGLLPRRQTMRAAGCVVAV